jgi:hypothetical protein
VIMPIRYERKGVASRVPGGGTIVHTVKAVEVVRDFAAKGTTVVPPFTGAGANASANAPTAGQVVDKLVDLVGRMADHLGINLLDLIKENELRERYSAVNVKD